MSQVNAPPPPPPGDTPPSPPIQPTREGRWWIDVGLLILRIGYGVMFILHGWPKITQQPGFEWAGIGQGGVGPLGITGHFEVWGFLAALAEFGGGIALVLGLLTRPFALMLLVTMAAAAHMHWKTGAGGPSGWYHAAEAGVVFLCLLIAGAGRLSLRHAFGLRRKCWFWL